MALTDEERGQLKARFEAKLQPERMRTTLAFAGLYHLTDELIEDAVVDEVRSYYAFIDPAFDADNARYQREVLSLHPNKFRASVAWLLKSHAITQAQADRLKAIHRHRNDLAHELLKYLVDPDFEPDVQLLKDALEILVAIRRFWIQMEIDIGSFEDFGEVSVDDVTSPILTALQMAIDAFIAGLPFGKEALKQTRGAGEAIAEP